MLFMSFIYNVIFALDHSFSLTYIISLCDHMEIYLPNLLLMGIWVVSNLIFVTMNI